MEVEDEIGAVAADWERLGQQSRSPFATWEWNSVWWECFGEQRPLLLGVCRRGGGPPCALLPLYRSRQRLVRVVRLIGHGVADQLGPVCAVPDEYAASAALHDLVYGLRRWDVFLAERFLAGGWRSPLNGNLLTSEPSPVLRIDGLTWEGLLAYYSRNLRQQIRRRERALALRHPLAFRLANSGATLDRDLDTLFALHRAKWGHEDAFAGARQDFHRRFARLALERGWLRLWLLDLDGEPVAAWYGFRFAQQEWYYQAGRDPRWDDAHVGFVLLTHTIREAVKDGVLSYQFLRGGEHYKFRFANQDCPVETFAVAKTPVGRAATALARRYRSLPVALRRELQRRIS